ncbi:hypothetical protein Tco_1183018 [Tanacetum coccineum]
MSDSMNRGSRITTVSSPYEDISDIGSLTADDMSYSAHLTCLRGPIRRGRTSRHTHSRLSAWPRGPSRHHPPLTISGSEDRCVTLRRSLLTYSADGGDDGDDEMDIEEDEDADMDIDEEDEDDEI